MVHIIVDDLPYHFDDSGRKKVKRVVDKAVLPAAFATGVQIGVAIVNYGGKVVSVMANAWSKIHDNLKRG
ncbi:hypothetical protein [Butyrivibrio sp. FCS006]|uniref:hypothetical protein n=1 Tax=Butyrivibrio sp. FCS006 TaxID=1280684 RepID=UPI000419E06A|nr:hypothetical protein [Butyrivibrio sp. FCS006]